jgi:hypothetical protein
MGEYYQLTGDAGGLMPLDEIALGSSLPLPPGPAIHGHREQDHVGMYNLIEVAAQRIAGWPPQGATKKIVGWRSGIEIGSALEWPTAAAADQQPVVALDITIEPCQVAKAAPWKHHDINFGGKKVDFVAEREGSPLATMDCPEPEAGAAAASAPYVLELSDEGGSLPIYYEPTGEVYLLKWQPATGDTEAGASLEPVR